MRKRTGGVCIVLGGLCMLLALGLLYHNYREERRAESMTREILPKLQNAIEPQSAPRFDAEPEGETSVPETILIDGVEYIGCLSVPALNLDLPVQSDWSYPKLKVSPCRYTGSSAGGDLIIAAHNYERHFGKLHTLQAGDTVRFTDAAGRAFCYVVDTVETLGATEVEELTSGDWGLTLFTCTYGGKSRVTVRCGTETDLKES